MNIFTRYCPLLIIVLLSVPAPAQETAIQDTAKKEIRPLPVTEITLQATQVNSMLQEKRALLLTEDQKKAIISRMDTLIFRLNILREDPRVHKTQSLNFRSLQNMETEWDLLNTRLTSEQTRLTNLLLKLEKEKSLLDEKLTLWTKTMEAAREVSSPDMVLEQVGSTIRDIKNTLLLLADDSDFLQEKLVEISSGLIFCNDVLGRIRKAHEDATKQLFTLNRPPIWKEFARETDTIRFSIERSFIEDTASGLKDFYINYSITLLWHALLFIVILFFIVFSFRNLKNYIPDTDVPQIGAVKKIIKRPVSSGILISFLLTYLLYINIPDSVRLINTLVLAGPVILILGDLISGKTRRFIYFPIAAVLLVQVHGLGYSETTFSRFFLLVIILFGLSTLGIILGRKSGREIVLTARLGRILFILLILAGILLTVSLISIIAGGVLLAEFITHSTIRSAALALIIYALTLTLNSLIITTLYSKNLQRLNVIIQQGEIIHKKLVNLVNFASWVLWVILTLKFFAIWDNVYGWGKNFLTHGIKIGSVELSLGNVIVFGFIIWLTLWLSRLIRIIIEGELAPRTKMRRGVPSAISLIIRITLITVGFLLAIAAAGVEMDKLAILLGALGVGIGFGLQNIFNNLVSGIILVFERPINEGDIIEIGPHWGTVKQIGIRASTIRTFDGAEVIIPNGNLISNELINWTLTDQQRRAEVTVGVKYGTDPEQVLQILRDVVGDNEEVLKDPKPLALFTAFGESSLDFRLLFWIPSADERLRLQSEIAVAVNKALKDAGIEIPFPQRDLYLKSVDEKITEEVIKAGKLKK